MSESCAFYAPKVYLTDNAGWPASVISADSSFDARRAALETGPYGRCVYHCDNDVVDHQVAVMELTGGASATFAMHGHSGEEGRTLRIDGTLATLRGVFSASDVRGTLASLSRQPAARNEHQRTVFKSVGSALEDLAAAMLVWETSSTPPGQQPHPG